MLGFGGFATQWVQPPVVSPQKVIITFGAEKQFLWYFWKGFFSLQQIQDMQQQFYCRTTITAPVRLTNIKLIAL
jgi:hypothetical protein